MVIFHSGKAATNQAQFDEHFFPFRKATIIDKYRMDCANDILFQDPSQLACFCASAGSSQWAVLHHLMEYIEGLPSFRITYRACAGSRRDPLSGYADSDWGNSSPRRSTSGNLMLYNKSPIMWRSKL
jgi:hypothetical protein